MECGCQLSLYSTATACLQSAWLLQWQHCSWKESLHQHFEGGKSCITLIIAELFGVCRRLKFSGKTKTFLLSTETWLFDSKNKPGKEPGKWEIPVKELRPDDCALSPSPFLFPRNKSPRPCQKTSMHLAQGWLEGLLWETLTKLLNEVLHVLLVGFS